MLERCACALLSVTLVVFVGFLEPANADDDGGLEPHENSESAGGTESTDNDGGDQPSFAGTTGNSPAQNQELVNKVMGDGIPDFNQIWNLPSLSNDQRDQMRPLYANFNNEIKPIQDELTSIRESVLGGSDVSQDDINSAAQQLQAGGGLPPGADASKLGDPNLLNRVNELRDQVKVKRQELWQQLKGILTPKQVEELQES